MESKRDFVVAYFSVFLLRNYRLFFFGEFATTFQNTKWFLCVVFGDVSLQIQGSSGVILIILYGGRDATLSIDCP